MTHKITRNKTNTKNNKRTIKQRTKVHRGGVSRAELQQTVTLRDSFRRMFKSLFTIIYNAQDKKEEAVYEKGIVDFLNALKRHKRSINTLIPITNNFIPIDKKIYTQASTPLIGFVPFLSILIYHLKNEKDIQRILIQFKRSSGNINLMSIKGEITALSTATDKGNVNIIKELLTRGADINLLAEVSRFKL
jgi:hypothetical protein